MKMSVPAVSLASCVAAIRSAADTKSTIPILGCVKIEANEKLIITANNMRLCASTTIDATIEDKGTTCINAEKFSAFVGHAQKNIIIETDEKYLRLSSGRMHVDLPTLDPSGFAILGMGDASVKFEIPATILTQLFAASIPSVLDNASFPALSGILLEGHNDEFWVVGSDTKRISAARGVSGIKDFRAILPVETANLLRRIMGKSTENIRVEFTDRLTRFSFGGFEIISRLIDATYPEYRRILVPRLKSPVVFDIEPLLAASHRALSIVEDDVHPTSLSLSTNGESMKLESRGKNNERFFDEIDADGGGNISFIVQARFVRDAMLALGGEGQGELSYYSPEMIVEMGINHGNPDPPPKARFNRFGKEGEFVILVPLRM